MSRTAPMRPHLRLIATCAAAAGVVLAVQGCGDALAGSGSGSQRRTAPVAFEPPETAAAGDTPAPVSSTAPPPAAILRGERQIHVLPARNEAALAVAGTGHIGLSDTFGDAALFVLTPTGGKHQIRTAKIRRGGEALCVTVRHNGTGPLTLTTTACDTGAAAQLFTVSATGEDAYSIAAAGGAYVRVSAGAGVIVEETGDGPAPTAFRLADRGQSALPALD